MQDCHCMNWLISNCFLRSLLLSLLYPSPTQEKRVVIKELSLTLNTHLLAQFGPAKVSPTVVQIALLHFLHPFLLAALILSVPISK